MKVNLTTTILNLDGTPLVTPTGRPLDMREIVTTSLTMARSEMDPKRAWDLAKLVHLADTSEIEMPIEEVAQLKQAIKAHPWFPMVIAQAYSALESVHPDLEKKKK